MIHPQPDLRLELVSDPRYLCAVREFLTSVARQLGFDHNQASQIALAVDEAIVNVIRHGYEGRSGRPVVVSVAPSRHPVHGPGLTIIIEDEARQVEPETIRGRDLADIRPGGLGVHIIREVMDSALYEKRPEGGMRLTLTKHLSSPAKACCEYSQGGASCAPICTDEKHHG